MSFSLSIPSLWRCLQSVPFASTLAIVLLLQVMGERFPFSPFPMYSRFDEEANVYFVTDGSGQPLAMRTYFNVGSSQLKKIYKRELRKISEARGSTLEKAEQPDRREAAERALKYLRGEVRSAKVAAVKGEDLKLVGLNLELVGSQIVRTSETLAVSPAIR